MIVLGLTGSIGMGKSTTAQMFADEGAVVWDADAAVHRLYGPGGAAVAPLAQAFLGVVVDGAVDRLRLAEALGRDEDAFQRLEAIVHPLVAADRAKALKAAAEGGARLAVVDIPLLFETGGDAFVDAVAVVTADAEIQAERVLARPGMTRERFDAILARQTPDAEKRARADFLIDTGHGLEAARDQVRAVVAKVLEPDWKPAPPSAWGLGRLSLLAEGVGGTAWRAVAPDGRTSVLKRLSPQAAPDAPHALAWLRWRDGSGAIRLLGAQGPWQWLEDAGDRPLSAVLETEGDEAATRIAADVLRALHAPSDRPAEGLQTMADRFAALGLEATRQGGLFGEAAVMAAGLMAEGTPIRPLHGDLHHDNVLHGPRGWLAIDPHGVLGDPAYDAANLLYNPLERQDLRTDPARARRLAEALGPAVGRPAQAVMAWGFCHACLSAAWHLEDENHEEAERSLAVARAIRRALEG